MAKDAGNVLGLELSLTTDEYVKLLGLVSHAAQAASPDAAVIKNFVDRVNQYVALHKKLEATLAELPEKATPEQIDQNERALGAMIQSARKTARRGRRCLAGRKVRSCSARSWTRTSRRCR